MWHLILQKNSFNLIYYYYYYENTFYLVLGFSCLKKNLGCIAQIIGLVLDIVFPLSKIPNIYNVLIVKGQDIVGRQINMACEVPQLLGNERIRTVTMSATDDLMRGMEVIDTGAPLSVSIGRVTLE